MITHAQVLDHFKSVRAVADFFDVKPSAVYQWGQKNKVPHRRQYELMVKLPEVFGEKNS
jgi:hypothetical protein